MALVQWLLQYDILLRREKAIQSFGKGLGTLGLLSYMQKFPKLFEPLFVWSEELLDATALLEMLEVTNKDMDEECSLIWDFLQEYISG